MKGAIASVEIYVRREGEPTRRLSLTITQPNAHTTRFSGPGGDVLLSLIRSDFLGGDFASDGF